MVNNNKRIQMFSRARDLNYIRRQKTTWEETFILGGIGLVAHRATKVTDKEYKDLSKTLIRKAFRHYNQAQVNYATDELKDAVHKLKEQGHRYRIDLGLLGLYLIDYTGVTAKKVLGAEMYLVGDVIAYFNGKKGDTDPKVYNEVVAKLDEVINTY